MGQVQRVMLGPRGSTLVWPAYLKTSSAPGLRRSMCRRLRTYRAQRGGQGRGACLRQCRHGVVMLCGVVNIAATSATVKPSSLRWLTTCDPMCPADPSTSTVGWPQQHSTANTNTAANTRGATCHRVQRVGWPWAQRASPLLPHAAAREKRRASVWSHSTSAPDFNNPRYTAAQSFASHNHRALPAPKHCVMGRVWCGLMCAPLERVLRRNKR